MEALDYFYRAYEELKSGFSKTKIYPTMKQTLAELSSEKDIQTGYVSHREIDMKWVLAIEESLVHIDKAIRDQRRFIEQIEEIVPIEKSRKITSESVRHLAQHTNMIAKVEGDEVTPETILNIFREESFAIYENRFICTLLKNLIRFVDIRYKALLEVPEVASTKIEFSRVAKYYQDSDSFELKYSNEYIEENEFSMNTDVSELSDFERILRIRRVLSDFQATPLMRALDRTERVRPPIIRTNLMTKNINFKKALDLWTFIESYTDIGYTFVKESFESKMEDSMKDGLCDVIVLTHFVSKINSNSSLKEKLKRNYEEENERRLEAIRQLEKKRKIEEAARIEAAIADEKKRRIEEVAAEKKLRAEQVAAEIKKREEEVAAEKQLREEQVAAEIKKREEEVAAEKQLREEQVAAEIKKREEEVAAEKQLREEQVAAEIKKREEEVAAEKQLREKQVTAEIKKRESEVAEQIEIRKREVAQLREFAENAITEERTLREEEVTKEKKLREKQVSEIKEYSENAINEEKLNTEKKLEQSKKECDETVKEKQEFYLGIIDKMKSEYEGKLSEVIENRDKELSEEQALRINEVNEITARNAAELEMSRTKWSIAMNEQRTKFEAQLEEQNTALTKNAQSQINTIKHDSDKKMTEINDVYESHLEAQRRMYESKIKKLQAQLDKNEKKFNKSITSAQKKIQKLENKLIPDGKRRWFGK